MSAEATLQRDRRTGRAWLTFLQRPGADTLAALKQDGWRWSGFRKAWHNPRRMVVPPAGISWEDGAQVDFADERADRLDDRAARVRATAAAELERARGVADQIPLGQPILVGHHSERRHRRDLARIDRGYERAFEGFALAEHLTSAAASSARAAALADDDGALQRRLDRLAADVRSTDRILARDGILSEEGARIHEENKRQAAEIRELLIERGVIAPDGTATVEVARGDLVKYRGRPFLVARVSRKTISGYQVGGGADAWPSRQADKSWLGSVLRPASPALLAALHHREALGGYYGDDTWRELIAKAMR